ncbi:DUF3168 domain-containing protein [Lentzea guizhouensis]|nr:DUF3168 domain-containing protein [Lentzea guizhouensis]
MTAELAVQTAIHTLLTADVELMAAVSGVYDQVPEPAAFPYIRLGDTTEVPDDNHSRRGSRVTTTLHIFSRYRGNKQGLQILGQVDRLLDRQALLVPGYRDVSCAREFHQTLRDPDPEIRHIPVRYRLWLTREDP